MNQTKQLILKKSLELFNKKGIDSVSLRDISEALNISVGNLQYHFKKREDIIEGLYLQLVSEIDGEVLELNKHFSLNNFLEIPTKIIDILFKYRFFLIDFVSISRNNKVIKKNYVQLSEQREKQFLAFTDILITENILREPLLKDEYVNLYKAIEVISNFWFSNCLIQKDALSKKTVIEYSLLIRQIVYPYLTENGKNQFLNFYSDLII